MGGDFAMKKILCLCLALCLLACLSACKKTPIPEITTRENITATTTAAVPADDAFLPDAQAAGTPGQAAALLPRLDDFFGGRCSHVFDPQKSVEDLPFDDNEVFF